MKKRATWFYVAVVDEEGGVGLWLDEAQAGDVPDEAFEPRPWCLTKTVEGPR